MIHLMHLTKDYAISELKVNPGDWLADTSLQNLQLPNEGIPVLGIQRADGQLVGAPRGRSVVQPYDTLILYGRSSVLKELDQRPADRKGDIAHSEAVTEHRQLEQTEEESES